MMAGQARNPRTYSRFVRVVKFALPILAIALLSTVFLVQQQEQFDGQLVFSDMDRSALDDGLTINNPQITGTTAGGGYRISAETATPDSTSPKEIRFTKLVARAEQQDGRTWKVTGDQGAALVASEVIQVEGNVVVTTSGGYRMETGEATAALGEGRLTTGPVLVSGPTGTIEAGGLRIEEHEDDTGTTNEFFFFEKGVKLVHQPTGNVK